MHHRVPARPPLDSPPALPPGVGIKPHLVPTALCHLGDSLMGKEGEGNAPNAFPRTIRWENMNSVLSFLLPRLLHLKIVLGWVIPTKSAAWMSQPGMLPPTQPPSCKTGASNHSWNISCEKTANSAPGLGLWVHEQFLYPGPLSWTGIRGGRWVGGVSPQWLFLVGFGRPALLAKFGTRVHQSRRKARQSWTEGQAPVPSPRPLHPINPQNLLSCPGCGELWECSSEFY